MAPWEISVLIAVPLLVLLGDFARRQTLPLGPVPKASTTSGRAFFLLRAFYILQLLYAAFVLVMAFSAFFLTRGEGIIGIMMELLKQRFHIIFSGPLWWIYPAMVASSMALNLFLTFGVLIGRSWSYTLGMYCYVTILCWNVVMFLDPFGVWSALRLAHVAIGWQLGWAIIRHSLVLGLFQISRPHIDGKVDAWLRQLGVVYAILTLETNAAGLHVGREALIALQNSQPSAITSVASSPVYPAAGNQTSPGRPVPGVSPSHGEASAPTTSPAQAVATEAPNTTLISTDHRFSLSIPGQWQITHHNNFTNDVLLARKGDAEIWIQIFTGHKSESGLRGELKNLLMQYRKQGHAQAIGIFSAVNSAGTKFLFIQTGTMRGNNMHVANFGIGDKSYVAWATNLGDRDFRAALSSLAPLGQSTQSKPGRLRVGAPSEPAPPLVDIEHGTTVLKSKDPRLTFRLLGQWKTTTDDFHRDDLLLAAEKGDAMLNLFKLPQFLPEQILMSSLQSLLYKLQTRGDVSIENQVSTVPSATYGKLYFIRYAIKGNVYRKCYFNFDNSSYYFDANYMSEKEFDALLNSLDRVKN